MEKSSQNPSFGQGLELAIIIEKALASAVKKTNADADKLRAVIGKPGVFYEFFEGLLSDKVEAKHSILRLISSGEKLMIEALDGKAHISDAKKTFKSFIDEDFKNWGLNQSSPATAETLLDVCEMTSDGTFVQIFTGITPDLERLVVTQAQIIRFCEKHPTWLRQEGYSTFFLTKVGGEYFVVSVYVSSDGLDVDVRRLGDVNVWDGEFRLRIVYPQLIDRATETEGNSLLRLVSEGQSLVIKALGGNRRIYNANETFTSFRGFGNNPFKYDKLGISSPDTLVQVHELIGRGTLIDIFLSLPGGWHEKCLTEDQVIEFCNTLSEWLTWDGMPTFFLIKKDEHKPIDESNPEGNLRVFTVRGKIAELGHLGYGGIWERDHVYRFVTPQLKPSDKIKPKSAG